MNKIHKLCVFLYNIFEQHAKWIMLSPALTYTLLLIAFPVVFALYMSLHQYAFGHPSSFVGLKNYHKLFLDPLFWNGFRITMILFVGGLLVELIAGLYIAILLDKEIKAMRWIRTLLLSPFVMPPVAVGMIWLVILDPSIGLANFLLESLSLPPSNWLASPKAVIPTLIMIDAWQWTPLVALIILGGLRALPTEPYEAAIVDGATSWQIFRYITLPLLRPTIFAAAMLRSIDLLRIFDQIYVTTEGGPGYSSMSLNIYAFKTGFEYFDLGYASAIMLSLLIIVIIINILLACFRRVRYEL